MAFAVADLDQVVAAEDFGDAELGCLEGDVLAAYDDIEDRVRSLDAPAPEAPRAEVPRRSTFGGEAADSTAAHLSADPSSLRERPSESVEVELAGAHAHDVVHSATQILPSPIFPVRAASAIASTTATSASSPRPDLDPHLGHEVDRVLGAPVHLRVPAWRPKPCASLTVMPAMPTSLRLLHLVELERFDDGGDQLHGARLLPRSAARTLVAHRHPAALPSSEFTLASHATPPAAPPGALGRPPHAPSSL